MPAIIKALNRHNSDEFVLFNVAAAFENMATSSGIVREFMRSQNSSEMLKGVMENAAVRSNVDLLKALTAAVQAINKRELETQDFKTLKSKKLADLEGEEISTKEEKKADLTKTQKNFLRAGGMVHHHHGSDVTRVILKCDDEFKMLICKDIKSKKLPTEAEQQKISKIKKIEEGRCLPEHQKKKMLGKFVIKDEALCFGILGAAEWAIECDTQEDRDAWVVHLQALLAYQLRLKEQNRMVAAEFAAGISGAQIRRG